MHRGTLHSLHSSVVLISRRLALQTTQRNLRCKRRGTWLVCRGLGGGGGGRKNLVAVHRCQSLLTHVIVQSWTPSACNPSFSWDSHHVDVPSEERRTRWRHWLRRCQSYAKRSFSNISGFCEGPHSTWWAGLICQLHPCAGCSLRLPQVWKSSLCEHHYVRPNIGRALARAKRMAKMFLLT